MVADKYTNEGAEIMSNIKERLFGAITVMSETDALKLWGIVEGLYNTDWEDIEEVEPDEIDLQMIHDANTDPDCHVFSEE